MNILYFGKFDHFYRTERYVTWSLEQAGQTVICQDPTRGMTLSTALKIVDAEKIDVVLFSKAETAWYKDFIKKCRDRKVLTVCWIWDLLFGYRQLRPAQLWSDICFSTDGGHEQRWVQHKINHEVLRQGIHKPEAKIIDIGRKQDDLCFVGSMKHHSKQRTRLIRFLNHKYGDRRVKYFTHKRGQRLNKALSCYKIVVGDSYPSANYWSNRIYEILGRGGFLLHPLIEGLDAEFEDGKHFGGYRTGDLDHLQQQIDYYLEHDDERREIQVRGHEHVRDNLTYCHRVQTLLKRIQAGAPETAPLGQSCP